MNREDRRALAGRVRKNIASEKEKQLFGRLGKANGQRPGSTMRGVCAALASASLHLTKTERNAAKRLRRARARS